MSEIPPAVWSANDLRIVRRLGRAKYDLTMITASIELPGGGPTRAQTDLALWALLGRSVEQAVVVLNPGKLRVVP